MPNRLIRIEIDLETGEPTFFFSDNPDMGYTYREFEPLSKTWRGLYDIQSEIEDYQLHVEKDS